LSAVRSRVEKAVGVGEPFAAAGIGGVGVKDVVADTEEDAQAVLLALLEVRFVPCPGLELGFVPEVVLNRSLIFVECDVEVVIEIGAVR
jgi:hypothetical protein